MEDLQGLLEKINKDGVEKAENEAKKIVDKARAEAQRIIEDARTRAEALKKESEQSAADSAARAAETIRNGARDTILKLKEAIGELLEGVLLRDVERALADEATVLELVSGALRELASGAQITAGEKLARALKAQLSAQGEVTVITDETMKTGFSVKTEDGRIEHAFTAEVIAAELAKRLRPELAKLLK